MPKQENTAINHLIGFAGRTPRADLEEPALFSTAPPAARHRAAPFGANLSPIGATIAPLPRRRAPAATPPMVPLHTDYADDDAATTVDPPAGWAALPSPPPLPPLPPPPLPPVPHQAAVQPLRPAYPAPHQPPAYYQAPYPDHLETMRVSAMPLDAAPSSLRTEVLLWIARLWIPFVALGVIAMTLGIYRLINDDAPIGFTTESAAERVAAAAAEPEPEPEPVAEPAAVTGAVAAAVPASDAVAAAAAIPASDPASASASASAPSAGAELGVPKDSLWQPTKPQPTFAPRVETAAAEPDIELEPSTARKPAPRATSDRSSRRAAKRAAAKRVSEQRAKQLALAELAPPPVKAAKPETKVVAIAAAKPMKIGAAATPAKGTGSGKLVIASEPPTLIYVDGRNTGMMTPKTLALSEGSHKITLLSPKDRIAKTIAVEIKAGTSTNLTRSFTK